ncbi:MAG: U32 family peptidase [Bacilli bacterium]|nr:U32 family peptidase [Bacilli bacterium]
MKILIEPITKKDKYEDSDGIILALKDYSVQSMNYYTIDEIKTIKDNNPTKEIFISINKNLMNEDIEPLSNILKELDKLNITGIFFYDTAVLELHRELDLKTDLVWSSTHMVNNYKTCNYYNEKGCKYALLGKEITLEEMQEIITNSSITSMVEVIGLPSVAFSKRKLVSNFYSDLGKKKKDSIIIEEKMTKEKYIVNEDSNGTDFFLDRVVNGTSIIKDLYNVDCKYIVLREYGIDKDTFYELVKDTKDYISNKCTDEGYIDKYKKLGDFTNFFFKKTIYKVKKNG